MQATSSIILHVLPRQQAPAAASQSVQAQSASQQPAVAAWQAVSQHQGWQKGRRETLLPLPRYPKKSINVKIHCATCSYLQESMHGWCSYM